MAATRNHISFIEYKNMRFLITDRPTDSSLDKYISVRITNAFDELIVTADACVDFEGPQRQGLGPRL